ncbi:MAG TPA: GrpB family protein [Phycisphaerae bacterium]|nr:GrpB family protein [Phycisphaerae bacterium]
MTATLVQPYDPVWPSHFEQIKAFLESGLVDVDCMIEHVGSTAIPGMMAKPIIDLLIVVAAGTFPKVKGRLEALGYVHQGDLGIPGREAFDLVDAEERARLHKHYPYVCEEGVQELRKQLAFRNFMRQSSEWREKLSRLKRELCVKHSNDRQAYMDGKADLVEEITKLAMGCAEQMHAEAPSREARDGDKL